ncbi:MAG: helix-turn-helix domain-containing protein [Granulosicoccus sp.]
MDRAFNRLPNDYEIESTKTTSRELSRFAGEERVHMQLRAQNQHSENIVLPGYLVDLMLRVATDVSMGRGVSILPIESELTTQQAAELLNISRPTMVRLLENNEIPFTRIGSHRRVRAQDLFEYRDRNRIEREQALDEMVRLSAEMGLYDDEPTERGI